MLNERIANSINKEKWKQTELEEVRWVDDYLLKVHGVAPGKKGAHHPIRKRQTGKSKTDN